MSVDFKKTERMVISKTDNSRYDLHAGDIKVKCKTGRQTFHFACICI